MKSIWIDLWELFFPRHCAVCGCKLQRSEKHLCLRCLQTMPRTHYHLQPDNPMEKNLWGKLPLGRATALFFYLRENPYVNLLYELKYYGNSKLGVYMGRYVAIHLKDSDFFQGVQLIVPVPLHPDKLRKRGYNQSAKLAEGISQVTGIPVATNVLIRQKFTDTQTRKSRFERWVNVSDIFACIAPSELEGKHILLVDDVMTTGATIVSCADALAGIPGLRISVLTLALVARH